MTGFPPHVSASRSDTLDQHWRGRASQHVHDSYAGLRMAKTPEDLRVYEHLLWAQQPDTVIELGCQNGGSTLWFADRLDAFSRYHGQHGRVIAVDLDVDTARLALTAWDREWEQRITLVEGDVTDPDLPARLAAGANCLVVEDTAHTHETTAAALAGFCRFVPPGGWFVVEDGIVDDPDLRQAGWPTGVRPAIHEFLDDHPEWMAVDLALYGFTCHPGGWLHRNPHVVQ